jgi:glutamyl-Q tRNA(Asp) synthetase
LTAYGAAQAAGGRFILRIEDIDTGRCRPVYEAGIFNDLAWLGLEWETPVWRQSQRGSAYTAALDRLRRGGLLYRCFRTRKSAVEAIAQAPHGAVEPSAPGPLDPETERAMLAEGRPFAWRLSLAAAHRALGGFDGLGFLEFGAGPNGETGRIPADPARSGDVVVARKDLGVSYHLAVVVDDAAQNVTHVIRGCDLFEAAHVQRLLQALLDLPAPVYHHHPLILRPDGRRFAKRDTAETLADLRAQGVTPVALRAALGF